MGCAAAVRLHTDRGKRPRAGRQDGRLKTVVQQVSRVARRATHTEWLSWDFDCRTFDTGCRCGGCVAPLAFSAPALPAGVNHLRLSKEPALLKPPGRVEPTSTNDLQLHCCSLKDKRACWGWEEERATSRLPSLQTKYLCLVLSQAGSLQQEPWYHYWLHGAAGRGQQHPASHRRLGCCTTAALCCPTS